MADRGNSSAAGDSRHARPVISPDLPDAPAEMLLWHAQNNGVAGSDVNVWEMARWLLARRTQAIDIGRLVPSMGSSPAKLLERPVYRDAVTALTRAGDVAIQRFMQLSFDGLVRAWSDDAAARFGQSSDLEPMLRDAIDDHSKLTQRVDDLTSPLVGLGQAAGAYDQARLKEALSAFPSRQWSATDVDYLFQRLIALYDLLATLDPNGVLSTLDRGRQDMSTRAADGAFADIWF